MLTITSKAKNKIKKDLYNERKNSTEFARIVYSPSDPSRIGFEIDQEKEDDWVIPDNEGGKLLLLDPDMMKKLGTFVIDYKEGADARTFIIEKAGEKRISNDEINL